MPVLTSALLVIASYLLGSIPTGYLVARARGVDIRTLGSGNIGATNVFRTLGKPAGTAVLAVDVLKGWLPVACATHWAGPGGGGAFAPAAWWPLAAGLGAIVGHNYTCWLGFKGGKGVATTGGVLLGLAPAGFGLSLGVWAIVFAVSRYVSLASIAAAISLPMVAWLTGRSGLTVGLMAAVGALAIFKHKANIRRLCQGTEHRFGRPPTAGSPS